MRSLICLIFSHLATRATASALFITVRERDTGRSPASAPLLSHRWRWGPRETETGDGEKLAGEAGERRTTGTKRLTVVFNLTATARRSKCDASPLLYRHQYRYAETQMCTLAIYMVSSCHGPSQRCPPPSQVQSCGIARSPLHLLLDSRCVVYFAAAAAASWGGRGEVLGMTGARVFLCHMMCVYLSAPPEDKLSGL